MVISITIVLAVILVVAVSLLRPLRGATAMAAVTAGGGVQRIRRTVTRRGYWLAGLGVIAVAAAALLSFNSMRSGGFGQKRAAPVAVHSMELPQVTTKLAARLERDPNDSDGWLLLGKSYVQLGRYMEAKQALLQALKRLPQNADVRCDWIETMIIAEKGNWSDETRKIVGDTLAANPVHQRTLWLAGSDAFDRKAYADATRYWEKLSTLAGADTEIGRKALSGIEKARASVAGTQAQTTIHVAAPASAASKPVGGMAQ